MKCRENNDCVININLRYRLVRKFSFYKKIHPMALLIPTLRHLTASSTNLMMGNNIKKTKKARNLTPPNAHDYAHTHTDKLNLEWKIKLIERFYRLPQKKNTFSLHIQSISFYSAYII